MSNISLKGIILGALVVLSIDIISVIAMIPLFASSMSTEVIESLFVEPDPLMMYSLFFGTLSTVVGGFVAANIGR